MPRLTPTFRAAGTSVFTANNVANPTNLSVVAPSAREIGDMLVLVTASRSNSATVSTPSGWNLVSGFPKASATTSGGKIYVFTRRATSTGSDTADNATVTWSGLSTGTSGDSAGARIIAWANVKSVLDGTVPSPTDQAAGSSFNIPAYTTSIDKSLVVGIGIRIHDTAHTFTVASPYTERVDVHTTTGTGHGTQVSETIKDPAGTVSATAITPSNTTSVRVLAISLALEAQEEHSLGTASFAGSGAFEVADIGHEPGGGQHEATLTDTEDLTDVLASVSAASRAEADDAGVSDVLASASAASRAEADDAGVSDVLASASAASRAEADDAGVSDVLASVSVASRAEAADAGLSDAPVRSAGYQRRISPDG